MNRLLKLGLALVLAMAPVVHADEANVASFFSAFDIEATSVTYFRLVGEGGNPFGPPIVGTSRIETSGSSATVTAVTVGSLPFADLDKGAVISVTKPDGTTDVRTVVAKASGDSITVGVAVDWDVDGGYNFGFKILQSGTAATDGWINVAGASEVEVVWQFDTDNLTYVEFVLEGLDEVAGSEPQNVHPGDAGTSTNCPGGTFDTGYCKYTTAGRASRTKILVGSKYSKLRVGALINTDGGAQSVTAYVKVIQWR